MSIKEMLESAAHAVWVPGDEKLSTAAPAKGATPSFTFPGLGNSGTAPTAAPSPFLVPGSVALDEGVYQKVLAKTNFETTRLVSPFISIMTLWKVCRWTLKLSSRWQ